MEFVRKYTEYSNLSTRGQVWPGARGRGSGPPPTGRADPRHSPAKGRAEAIEPHNLVSLCDSPVYVVQLLMGLFMPL